jgi:hypothetical protein
MTLVGGKMKKRNITLTNSSLPTIPAFDTLEGAINYSKDTNQKRMFELGLDITLVQDQCVKQFHWDDQNLVLEFDDDLFLNFSIRNQYLDIRIEKNNSIVTDRKMVFKIQYSSGMNAIWNPQKIANTYTGKKLVKMQIGEQYAWLYFHKELLLIFCTVHTIKESDNLFLLWDESE